MARPIASSLPSPDLAPDIRSARLNRNWSLRRLSEISGVDDSYISRLERGAATPSVDALFRLACALELRDVVRTLSPYVRRRAS